MSRITKALKRAEDERRFMHSSKGSLLNSWLIWVFIIGVVITVFVAFNYQSGNDVPLSEIFPEEETYPVDIEYEFIEEDGQAAKAKIKEVKQAVEEAPKIVNTAAAPQEETAPKMAETPAKIAAVQQPPKAAEKREVVYESPVLTAAEVNEVSFAIQIASFKKQASAQQKIEELKKRDISAYIVARDLGDQGTWYRVYVGRFNSKEEAQAKLTSIRQYYKDSFIITPKK